MQLSVIITTYNRPDALVRVLEGLSRQTQLPDEVVIADDGSGPNTAATIERCAGFSPFPLEHVWHPDRGFRVAAIRNQAIHRSTGDSIIFLDGDCVPERHFIQDHARLAERGFFYQGRRMLVSRKLSPTFTVCQADTFWQKMQLLVSGQIANRHHLMRLPWLPPRRSTSLNGVLGCNMGVFRDDLYAVNGFNEDFEGWGREDSELAVRLYHYGLKRKTHRFAAICFHLWHTQNDRKRLFTNDALLAQMMATKTSFCARGLNSK
jgi:glycosyltransferase involved in cell wall biosynthesis